MQKCRYSGLGHGKHEQVTEHRAFHWHKDLRWLIWEQLCPHTALQPIHYHPPFLIFREMGECSFDLYIHFPVGFAVSCSYKSDKGWHIKKNKTTTKPASAAPTEDKYDSKNKFWPSHIYSGLFLQLFIKDVAIRIGLESDWNWCSTQNCTEVGRPSSWGRIKTTKHLP